MNPSLAARARALCALTVLMYVAMVVVGAISVANHTPEAAGDLVFEGLFGLGLLTVAVVGYLVAAQRPENPVGWILLGGPAVMTLSSLGGEYAVLVLFTHPGPPGGVVAAWLTEWLFVPVLFMLPALLLLLFPDGRLTHPRWRVAVWLCVAGGALYLVSSVLLPGRIEDAPFTGVANPYGLKSVEGLTRVGTGIGLGILALSVVLGATSMVLRLRRSRGVQRAQLKWVAAAAALFALACVVGVILVLALGTLSGAVAVVLSFLLLPFTAGVVILRHRLYDVDVVIRRTLIYGTVTATLVGTYVALVLGLGLLVTSGSDLVVAVSTLAVAGLFGPVRSRVQAVVDRRFFRDRYDANLVLDRFEARLRTDPDLQAVGAELVGAVRDTVQPAHLWLWLRER